MPKQSTTPNDGSTTTGASGRSKSAGDSSIFSPLGDNVYLNKISSVLQDFLNKAGQITHSGAFNATGSPKKNATGGKKGGRHSAAAQLGTLGNLARRFDALTAILTPASSALKTAHDRSPADNAALSRNGQSSDAGATPSLIAQASDGVNSIYLSATAAMQAQQRIAGLVPSARWASGITAPSLPGNVASLLQAQQSINLPANLLPQVGAGATSQTGAEGLDTLAGTAQESFVGVEETSLMLSALSNADLDDGDGGNGATGGIDTLQAISSPALQLLSQSALAVQSSAETPSNPLSDMMNGHYRALSSASQQSYVDQRVVNNITINVPENSNLDTIKQYIEEALRKYTPNSSAYSYNSMTSNLIS
ncbi:hypothetical protein [Dickeya solani]|uniref:Uncharacterized protein n=1 Tax=Dickeya solani TaxID=1089444 RepID=A0ABU4EG85_9GAMM|nr:hypothetical protein [Dickeya solani]MCA6999181.1 hypothetical protein [Dickeya solani]MCZ0823806.1 hypothetical protein [Dickeya solani]MDV6995913.1 hypothetical protein [Dickeya solani]MDV7005692.1 hypothetical protein [Dickeya solani]MDV7037268.1 hypothetical protein [Dickeya solani]